MAEQQMSIIEELRNPQRVEGGALDEARVVMVMEAGADMLNTMIGVACKMASAKPAHRVAQVAVVDWINGLNGKAPTGADAANLIDALTQSVLLDRIERTSAIMGEGQ